MAPVAAAQLVLTTWAAMVPSLAVVLIGATVVVLVLLVAPVVAMVAVFPATFASWRVGPASIDMSVTDAVTIVAIVAALPFVPWRSRALRRILMAALGYCAVLLITVAAHPAQRSLIEAFHQLSLVAGTMCIGAAVARLGHVRVALRALMVAAAVVSMSAIVDTLTHHLRPAYPLGAQKNGVGDLLAMCLVVLLVAPRRLELRGRTIVLLSIVLLGGLAASQSRGAGLALVGVFALHLLHQRRAGVTSRIVRLAPLLLVASLVLIAISAITYTTRDENKQTAKFNSVNSRLDTYSFALTKKWEPDPVFGAGLKWFNAPGAGGGVPHNFVIGELSEVGLIGLVAMLALLWVVLRTTRRADSDLAEAGYLVLVERLLATMVDIFWVAGPGTLPFLIIGLVIGDEPEVEADVPARLVAVAP